MTSSRAARARTLRILWITTSAGSDGPGRALSGILSRWPEDDAIAVCALGEVAPAFREAIPARVETIACQARGTIDVRALRRVDHQIRHWRPDVIHTQLSRGDWVGRVLGRLRGVPVVSTIQNVHSRMYAAEFAPVMATAGRALDRLTFPLSRRFIAVSTGVSDDLVRSGVDARRITVIPNTFDRSRVADPRTREAIRAAWGVTETDVVVGTVALLKPQKGIRTLVDAARLALAGDARLLFVHIGDGPLGADVRRWVDEAGIQARFRLLGPTADPMTLLPGLDLFALPSEWEGLPVALLEAMAAGLPAVGTRVSGIEDVIKDGETGRLVPAGDPRALADALVALAGAPDDRRRMGEMAADSLGPYDPALVAQAYRGVYVDVLEVRPTG